MDISSNKRTRRKQGYAEERAILAVLAKRFPFGISLDPRLVLPLSTSTPHDLRRVMQFDANEEQAYLRALAWYQNGTPYLRAVAVGRKRHSLWGEALSEIPAADRNAARTILLKRGAWSDRLENIYRSHIGHLVKLEPKESASRRSHDARLAAWRGRLHDAGFSDDDIERIQRNGLSTDDLPETRRALDALPPS